MSAFAQISLVIFFGACLGAIATLFRQPPLIGYILSGMVLGFLGLSGSDISSFQTMSQLGVTLLLFLVGLELSFSELKSVGRMVFLIAVIQVAATFCLGFLLSGIVGFSPVSSFYISLALSFSSTIIGVKLLSEKKDLTSLYGKMTVGILLIQDFIAISILILLTGFESPAVAFTPLPFITMVLKGALLLYVTVLLSRFVFPRFMRMVALSQEMVFVTAIAWALGFATIVSLPLVGFSSEIGGFLAGLALANSREHYQIISRIRPVRDFFTTIFFIVLGTQMVVSNIGAIFFPTIILSVFVLVGHPLIILTIMRFLGFRKRTSFRTGIALAQISEFGLIIVALGGKMGHIDPLVVSLVSAVGVTTMVSSTYMILLGPRLYRFLSPGLSLFEKKDLSEQPRIETTDLSDHLILIGFNRVGRVLLPALKKLNQPIVVVDFNPAVITELTAQGIPALFGDISDYEFLDLLKLEKAAMIVSTVIDVDDTLVLLEKLKKLESRPLVVAIAAFPSDAIRLYEAKADFVLLPHYVGGEHLAHLIAEHKDDKKHFHTLGRRHFDELIAEQALHHHQSG